MEEQKTLRDYINKKGITIKTFSEMTGVSMPHLFRILDNPGYNIKIDLARKIYHGTLKKDGSGLDVWSYIKK